MNLFESYSKRKQKMSASSFLWKKGKQNNLSKLLVLNQVVKLSQYKLVSVFCSGFSRDNFVKSFFLVPLVFILYINAAIGQG